ncbi:MAG: biopolymer transporter ExbD [Pseudomonadota bacterium]
MNHRSESTAGPDLTPMLDVVFIMLIFFVVTATFVVEQGLDLNPPEPGTERPPSPEAVPFVIRITGADRYLINGDDVDVRLLRARLEQRHAQNPEQGLVIVPEDEASNGAVVALLDRARAVPGLKVSFAEPR